MLNRPMQLKTQNELSFLFIAVPRSAELTCLFGSFVFLQFTVLGLAGHAGEGYLSPGQRELVYYALQIFVILGYLLYSIFSQFCTSGHFRGAVAYGVFGLFFVCGELMLATGSDSLFFVILSMTAALCLGGVGGAAHHRMSLQTVTGANVARYMGIGSTAAVLLQYLLQIHWGVTPLLPVFMGAAYILLGSLLLRGYPETAMEENRKPDKTQPQRIVFAVLIEVTFLLLVCFYNETIHHRMIRSNYTSASVYSWPRLLLIPGYLLFSLIGDRENGKYVPITALCIMLTALLNVVLTGYAGAYWLNMCFFYFALAALTSYYLLTFWRLAPETSHPAFWAPMGRILDSAMVLFTGAIHLSTLPAPVVLGADIAGVAMIILLMAINGNFNFTAVTAETSPTVPEADASPAMPETDALFTMLKTGALLPVPETDALEDIPKYASAIKTENFSGLSETAAPEIPQLLSPEEALVRMCENYQLTPREAEVLRELVLTEDKQTKISDQLSIQVRTLQNHVTQLYRKTGAPTRAGLTELYYENRKRN